MPNFVDAAFYATVTPFGPSDVAAIGAIAGFHVAGGFTLALVDTNGAEVATLLKQARATFNVDAAKFASVAGRGYIGQTMSVNGLRPACS